MMGSLHEADDLVQDTFLRAWRGRSQFDGRGSPRGWLYRNRLQQLPQRHQGKIIRASHPRAARTAAHRRARYRRAGRELAWLEPYPDLGLPDLVDGEPGPEARYETGEAVRLAFVAAIQLLPPRQRASLLLCDVLGWSAIETAQLLGGSTAAINSALQRARATLAMRYPAGVPSTLAAEPRGGPASGTLHAGLAGRQSPGPRRIAARGCHLPHAAMAGLVPGTPCDPRFLQNRLGQFRRGTTRSPPAPTACRRSRSTRAVTRSPNGELTRCMSSKQPKALSPH